MYAFLQGSIVGIYSDHCVIEVHDIGYNVRISPSIARMLPPIGEYVRLYTYTSVREDAIQLYGFLSNEDLQVFRQLITVSGVGPKGGMAILGEMDADSVRFAIVSGDVKALSKAPGIGKRTAERIILELKEKMNPDELLSGIEQAIDNRTNITGVINNSNSKDACEALVALGYSTAEAMTAIKNLTITEDMEVDDIIKLALKEMF